MSDSEQWIEAVLTVAKSYMIGASEENIRVSVAWDKEVEKKFNVERIASQAGLSVRREKYSRKSIQAGRTPLIAEFKDGRLGVVHKVDPDGNAALLMSGDKGLETPFTREDLRGQVAYIYIARPTASVSDARVDEYIKPYRRHWFWSRVFSGWRHYIDIAMASAVANLLALAGIIFSMQIYDRVIPSQSIPTLWVLFSGVCIAACFEFALKLTRSKISDLVGKRIDLNISDLVFGRALRIRNDSRSKSTGTFIAQIRELEHVREMITSTTVSAMTDIPFIILFLFILYWAGGPLVFVVLAALPLLLLPGLLAQRPLAKLSAEGMREAAIRNAMLVEAVEGIEDIKLLRAENRFQNIWNRMNDVSSDISIKQRSITNGLLCWTQQIQGMTYATVLLTGGYLAMNGDITTGALVGTSILASRMMAPITQLAGILARWQNAKVARTALNELMKRPVDYPEKGCLIHKTSIAGSFKLENVQFQYNEEDKKPILTIDSLEVKEGERVAVLGKIGAGKSTLLHLLSGLHRPQTGMVRIEGLDINLIDPADIRREVGLLSQNARLFFGTVRENLIMGNPLATDEELMEALRISGSLGFVQKLPGGLEYQILEGGRGLSGGQCQALLLARTILCNPRTVLLDEPTASFDEHTEKQVIANLQQWLNGRTMIVATHRMAMVESVDRIIVIENGRIIKDQQIQVVKTPNGNSVQVTDKQKQKVAA